jgi:hypothetical protein
MALINLPIRAHLVLGTVEDGDFGVLDISSFTITYELNGIPTAIVAPAVGRPINAYIGDPEAADLQYIFPGDLGQALPFMDGRFTAKIRLKVDRFTDGPIAASTVSSLGLPIGRYVTVFDGFTTAPGWVGSPDSAVQTLSMVGWLADLNSGSMFSDISHPSNPFSFTYGTVTSGGTGFTAPGDTDFDRYVTPERLKEDLWGASIRPWLLKKSEVDMFRAPSIGIDEATQAGVSNSRMRRALVRMPASLEQDRVGDDPEFNADRASQQGGLALEAIATVPTALESISIRLKNLLSNPNQPDQIVKNNTPWSLIVNQLAPEFMFAVVPRPDDALVVPFTYNYKDVYKTVTADQCFRWRYTGTHAIPLRAVAVMYQGPLNSTGGGEGTGLGFDNDRIVGLFPDRASVAKRTGMIDFKPAPAWLSDSGAADAQPGLTKWVKQKGVADAIRPKRKDKPVVAAGLPNVGIPLGGAPAPDQSNLPGNSLGGLLDNLAKGYFASDYARTRSADLIGALRFDIAPGSTIRVAESAAPGAPKIAFTACVYMVTISCAVSPTAGAVSTTLSLVGFRSDDEAGDNSSGWSIAKHPIYKTSFSGAPLIDATT